MKDMKADYPDGISRRHASPHRRHARPVSLILLGALMIAALLGLFGGQRSPALTVETDAARLSVHTPLVTRNGIFFETMISVTPKRDIADLTVTLSDALWRDITINSQIPAAQSEDFGPDGFRFSFGPRRAGETLRFKIDGQINPPRFGDARGTIAVKNGDETLASLPTTIAVRP